MQRAVRSHREVELILREARRRGVGSTSLLGLAFDKQRRFIDDPSRFKVAVCTRRAGKTFGVGLYLLLTALSYPNSNCLYLARSRGAAKNIIVKDVFNDIIERLGLKDSIEYNMGELSLTLSNGSVIRIAGADADHRQIANLVGVKNKLVIIDEAQYFSSNLWRIVYEGLQFTLQDQQGTIVLLGVPTSARGFFYDVCTRQIDHESGRVRYPGWSIHTWSALDNPHQVEAYSADLKQMLLTDPLFMQTPTFKQQWLCEWADNPDARCYGFTDERNRIDKLPGKPEDYVWLCGMDVGFKPDPMAFVVMCYRRDMSDQALYIVYAHKQTEMSIDAVEAFRRGLELRWPIGEYVIDAHNRNVFNELTSRFSMPLVDAQHPHKVEFIRLLNDDITTCKVLLVGHEADGLAKEWMNLVWDESDPERIVPDPACQDHLADAALYGWRRSQHYFKAPVKHTEQALTLDQQMDAEERRLMARTRRKANDRVGSLYAEFSMLRGRQRSFADDDA